MERALRICFVAYRGNPRCGGQGIYLWFLVRELTRRGHCVDVLVGPPYPDPMPFAREVLRLPNDRFWGKWFEHERAGFLPQPTPLRIFEPLRFYELAASWLGFLPEPFAFSVRAFRVLAQRLKQGHRYDLIHDVQCLGWGLLGVRALGLPVVTTIHHPLSVDRRASFDRDRSLLDALGSAEFYPLGMQAFVARRLERVLTSSRSSARRIQRDFRVRPERICMVGNGVDTDLFRPDPRVQRSATELLCVARAADPNKGVLTLVEAMAHLPRDTRLTLVDDDLPKHPARKRAQALGLGARVTVVGSVSTEALLHLYRRATLVVVPSKFEGFGLPAAEAMACGTPVVASAAGALPELLRAEEGDVLVAPGDPQALAKGIATLLEQPEARVRLGERARRRMENGYAWPSIAARTEEAYREVLNESERHRGRPARTTTSAQLGSHPASPSSA
jgi:glycosyltransferase involved in cell wall biosynthesis